MMAVRYGLYKAHYWTWTNSLSEYQEKVSNHEISPVFALLQVAPLFSLKSFEGKPKLDMAQHGFHLPCVLPMEV